MSSEAKNPNAVAGPSKPKTSFGGMTTIGIHADTIDKSNPRGIPFAPFVASRPFICCLTLLVLDE